MQINQVFSKGLDTVGETTFVRKLRRQFNKLWVRIALIGFMSLLAIIVARLTEPFIPDGIKDVIGAGSIGSLLQIIANSMLAVTTFSLTVMVSVFRSASSQWTPRIHRLMMDDQITQTTLSTLVGAYIYALASIILLETQLFSDDQVVVLFCFTIIILILIIIAIVRWIVHLQTLGSLIETTRRIEEKTKAAFSLRMENPCLGANPLTDMDAVPDDAVAVKADETGYIQFIYEQQLAELAEKEDIDIYFSTPVGHFVYKGEAIAYITAKTDGIFDKLNESISIGDLRTFEQDPRFGLIVLGEIGSKALSPGINDPGTAIDVVGRMARIFDGYRSEMDRTDVEVAHPRLWLPPLEAASLVEDGFDPIARDGGGIVEVQLALQKALDHLSRHPDDDLSEAAVEAAKRAFKRAEKKMDYGQDLERLRDQTPAEVTNG
ncbi:DUF2254 domain-containing protein [Pseudooctadecabacter sp.]|uniref:DUF2254 domain-containing protein n=1 Tax=Pseudooctadecabacter sp. TaxID=1966338 RepID=UPI0025FE5D10|nr:DUF2254 domain-containing protein [Pseudooctadecabacter sp.]